MASHSRSREREDERHLSLRTLVIASLASFTAAIITAQFAPSGTPIAAAVTPVLVALVSELLHRPTKHIAERLTSDRPGALPEGMGAGSPATERRDDLPDRAPAEPGSEAKPGAEEAAPVRVYGSGAGRKRRRIAIGVVATTAVLAFAIAAAALTLPEIIAGESLGESERGTSIFGGKSRRQSDDPQQQEQPATTPTTTTEPSTETTEEPPPDDQRRQLQGTTPTQTTPVPPTTTAPPQQPQP